jgi:hypothetical protein
VPKWHTIAFIIAESASFTGLIQEGTVRTVLAGPGQGIGIAERNGTSAERWRIEKPFIDEKR